MIWQRYEIKTVKNFSYIYSKISNCLYMSISCFCLVNKPLQVVIWNNQRDIFCEKNVWHLLREKVESAPLSVSKEMATRNKYKIQRKP